MLNSPLCHTLSTLRRHADFAIIRPRKNEHAKVRSQANPNKMKMTRSKSTICATFLLLLIQSASLQAQENSSPPNIVFFYADDLGYGDLACYGSPVAQTPTLDQLAEEGTRFTQFYVSHCVCSPTRASAITGHFPNRHRIYGHLAFFTQNQKRYMPHWLDVRAPSFPRALQSAGYRTAMIGKWHLGGGSGRTFQMADLRPELQTDPPQPRSIVINHPDAPPVSEYGFDHTRTMFGNSPTWKDAQPWPEPHGTYPYVSKPWSTWSSKAIADETIGFLRDHKKQHAEQPFYVNVWFKDVHTVLLPTDEMRRPFADLDPKPQTHYAMVRFMDQQISRVLEQLEDLKLAKNTIVIFSSDNGGIPKNGASNGPLRGGKHSLYEGGIRVPLIVRWPGKVPAGRVDETSVLNICDLIPTLSIASGANMPEGYESDGEDITAAILGQSWQRTRPQFWFYPSTRPSLAMRSGNWKLLTSPDAKEVHLYNLSTDIGETKNLAEEEPERAKELLDQLMKWHSQDPLHQRM